MVVARIRLVPMASWSRDKNGKTKALEDNEKAFAIYQHSLQGKEHHDTIATAQDFFSSPAFSGGGWFANPHYAKRFFIVNEHNQTVGIIGCFFEKIVDINLNREGNPRDTIVSASPEQWERWREKIRPIRDKKMSLAGEGSPQAEQIQQRFQRFSNTALYQRGIANSKHLPANQVTPLPEMGLYISPEFQGKGYGSAAVEKVNRLLKSKGFQFIFMDTEAANKAMIGSAKGWEVIPWSRPRIGADGKPRNRVFMVKKNWGPRTKTIQKPKRLRQARK